MDIRDLSQFIRKIPLFSIYTDEDLEGLMEGAELRSVSAGEVIFEQDEPGDKFYLVYSGKVRIVKKNKDQKEISLGLRTKGDHFGETALIQEGTRNATARATEDSILIEIDRDEFDKYLFSQPALREYFDKFIKNTSIHQFLKTCTNLSDVSPKDFQELARQLTPEFYNANDVVFRQGASPDKFYLVESGKLKVVKWDGEKQELINFLREGDFFGEKALLEDSTRFADVVCLTECHLFSLTREAFDALVDKSPKLRMVIEDRIRSYLTDKPPIPYSEIIKQELAATKDIAVEEEVPEIEEKASRVRKKYSRKLSSFYRRRISFPFIMQHDQMTCGTTGIAMIAKYYGKKFSSARLRELAYVDLSGSSMANLASAAEQLGFSTRGLKLDYDALMSIHLPCIAHWQGYHYIVVYKIDKKHVWVADPALGHRKYKKEYFVENTNGITLTLEPTLDFEDQTEDQSSWKKFIGFVLDYKLILFEIFIASLLLNLFGLASPIFTQNIIDKVLIHQNVSLLNIMLIGMVIVLVFRILTMVVRQYLIIHTSMKIDLKMLVLFYKHLLALPLGYFKVRKIGDFITRFGENMKIRNFLTNTALTMVLDTILIIVYLSLMFYYNTQLTVLILVLIPFFILITLVFTPILKRLNIDSFAARAESESHLIESINGIDTVKAMNVEYQTRWKWEDKFIKTLNIDFKLYNTSMYFNSLGELLAALSMTLVLWYGAHKVLQGAMTIGELMAFMALTGSVITPINRIISTWDDIQEILVSVARLNDVFTAKSEFPESMTQSTDIVLRESRGEIEFDKVYFRYGGEDDSYILSNISLKIPSGQTMAIVGRSGSGKTTLVKLIARFYEVTEGKISIDGYDINNVDLSSLRHLIGFVLQENFIFSGTIRENIALGGLDENVERVIEAAQLANAHDFISNLPAGYESQIGESGLLLSGGQIQRIAIARVLYSNPKVIIFDEATSSLDTESEKAIHKNLNAMLQNKTAVIIAHRLSTVREADNIIVLDNGEIVEQGNHDELMSSRGLYHYLNHQQLNL